MRPRRDESSAIALFLAVTFGCSLAAAGGLRLAGWLGAPAPLATQLFSNCLVYAMTMGWPPIVATWVARRVVAQDERLDLGLRSSPLGVNAAAALAAVGLVGVAALVGWLAVRLDAQAPAPASVLGAAEAGAPAVASASAALIVTAAFAGTIALVLAQALTEEIGWRGDLLPRLMRRYGRWRGLAAHGVLWGLWYAPVVALATTPGGDALRRALAFVPTCALLGLLLGWLRLATRSVVPAVVANTAITLAAGWPYLLQDLDAGPRGALFGPAGWLVMGALGLGLLARGGAQVRLPGAEIQVWTFSGGDVRPPRSRDRRHLN